MVGGPPPLWWVLTEQTITLPRAVSWGLWDALAQAQSPRPTRWRESLLTFDEAWNGSMEQAAPFLAEMATLHTVVGVVEALVEEGVCPRLYGTRVEELLFSQTDATGAWTQPRGRQSP